MSLKHINLWVTTAADIKDLIKRQNVLKTLEPIEDNRFTFKIFSELYVLYVDLAKNLGNLYRHTYQVQKREVVRSLLHAAVTRLFELRKELKNFQLNEFVYIDNVLLQRKLTPYDVDIWRSPDFLYRRSPSIQNILYDNRLFKTGDGKERFKAVSQKRFTQAVILIQSHERCRRACVLLAAIKYDKSLLKQRFAKNFVYTYTFNPSVAFSSPMKRTNYVSDFVRPLAKCQHMLTTKIKQLTGEELEAIRKQREWAATVLQKNWRRHKAIKVAKQRRAFRADLLDMRLRRLCRPNEHTNAIVNLYRSEVVKKQLDEDFVKLVENERTRLLQLRTPWIMEDISDHIRDWFREFYEKLGEFHPYPEALKGGTILVITDETMTPMEYKDQIAFQSLSKDEKKKRAETEKLQKQKEKEKLKKEKMKQLKRRKKLKEAGIYDIAHEFSSNSQMTKMEKVMERYSNDWRFVDEYLNKNHDPIKEWITEDELAKIHQELRLLVDEYMRLEYELLQQALAADKKRKYKPPKQKKPKPPAAKKRKKTKKTPNVTDDRPIESVYQTLLADGIVTKYKTKILDDYIGEMNFTADDERDENNFSFSEPNRGDIRILVQEVIMSMGETPVERPKSVCIIGPPNSGNRLLANIIACESDALLLDLSPEKTFMYADKINDLINDVLLVARAFQPAILYIHNAHRVFWKKVPAEAEALKPSLLKTIIFKKIIKPLKKTDRIMILATSDAPWTASGKFKKAFQKFILVPKTHYGTTFLAWMKYMRMYLGADGCTDYVISSLTRVFKFYTPGDIKDCLSTTLNIKRRMELFGNPLDPMEFADFFLNKTEPIFPPEQKMLDKYYQWYNKVNKLSKMKAAHLKKLEAKGSKRK